jgi:GTP:adenosylcobinamide-phosphate guanylyltransferase
MRDKDSHEPLSPMRRSFSPTKTGMSGTNDKFGTTTMNNFNFRQDKEKQEAAAERLIHSVNAVTDLLKANTKLRENVEKV